jgi:hypothetical protein
MLVYPCEVVQYSVCGGSRLFSWRLSLVFPSRERNPWWLAAFSASHHSNRRTYGDSLAGFSFVEGQRSVWSSCKTRRSRVP